MTSRSARPPGLSTPILTAAWLLLVASAGHLAAEANRPPPTDPPPTRWSAERADRWYRSLPWLVGCNFIPSTAVNPIEMWQAETFDPETIDRELGWARGLGMNTVRTFLHWTAWSVDPDGFKARVERFLGIAARHGIRPALVLLDDCWNPDPKPGPQPPPVPGVHNSRWVQSPGAAVVNDPSKWGPVEAYVRDVVRTFGRDDRVLFWDLYNEPGAGRQGPRSLPLLKAAFRWVRSAGPTQPLTAGLWSGNKTLNAFQLEASDIVTFHNYGPADRLKRQIADLKAHGRPVICTEWMRRPVSTIATHLPLFKAERVGCYLWGLVAGKTQTIYPWGSKPGAPEPKVWFHDLLRPDGTPHIPAEADLLRRMTGRP